MTIEFADGSHSGGSLLTIHTSDGSMHSYDGAASKSNVAG